MSETMTKIEQLDLQKHANWLSLAFPRPIASPSALDRTIERNPAYEQGLRHRSFASYPTEFA